MNLAQSLVSKALFGASAASQTLKLPLLPFFALEAFSHLQIISLVFYPAVLIDLEPQNHLSQALDDAISYIKKPRILDPFASTFTFYLVLCTAIVYLVGSSLLGIGAIARKNKTARISKILTLSSYFHSRIIFYFVHYFLVKAIHLQTTCKAGLFFYTASCSQKGVIMICALLIVLNTGLALLKELFCFQIHPSKSSIAVKENLYNLLLLIHKALGFFIYFLVSNPAKAMVIINIFFTITSLAVLHSRLSYYNMKILKLAIVLQTSAALLSLCLFPLLWNGSSQNILIIFLAACPLTAKLSLIKVQLDFVKIISLRTTQPYKMAHLPILLKNGRDKLVIFPMPRVINKETFYSLGFLSQQEDKLTDLFENKSDHSLQEIMKHAYSIAVTRMFNLLNQHPNNELLLICITQIYLKKLQDTSKTLYILSLLKNCRLSVSAQLSIDTISTWLKTVHAKAHQKLDKNYTYFDYFAYRKEACLLKKHITTSIHQHISLWKELRQDFTEVLKVIVLVQTITKQTKLIKSLWQSNFRGKEGVCLNATIMYSSYVQMVQSLPRLSFSLMKKAFDPISKKSMLHEDMLKVLNGKSSVLLASIEASKIGKIIDASSSVEKMFEIKREALIGANAGILMPRFIARKHNDTINRYYKNEGQQQDFKKEVRTYARTLHDNYFQVEIKLGLHPLIDRGLNMIVFLEKLSAFESLIILDHQSNIIELSQNLKNLLNISDKHLGSFFHISKICPNFMAPTTFAAKRKSGPDRNTTLHLKTRQETLKSQYQNPEETGRALLSSERFTRHDDDQDSHPLLSSPPNLKSADLLPLCRINDDKGNSFQFYPIGGEKLENSLNLVISHIEDVVFEGDRYIIVKIKNPLAPPSPLESPRQGNLLKSGQRRRSVLVAGAAGDQFAEIFPTEDEKPDPEVKDTKLSPSPPFDVLSEEQNLGNNPLDDQSDDDTKIESFTKGDQELHFDLFRNINNNNKKHSAGAASIAASQSTQRDPTDAVKNFKRLEKPRPAMKMALNLVYLSVVIIIAAMIASLLYNKRSLEEMKRAMSIVNVVNIRVSKAIMAWQSVIFIYLRSVGLRPSNSKVLVYVETCRNATLDMLSNALETSRQLSSISDKVFLRTLFDKTISFWEPLDYTLFNNEKIESFTASEVLITYNMNISRFNGTFSQLKNQRNMLFTMNNTVNDYLLTLENAIQQITDFLTDTNNKNISLLKAIVALENIFVAVPLLLIINQFLKNAKLYRKLFNAFTQVRMSSLNKRSAELENIKSYFEKTLEDDVHIFKEIPDQLQEPTKTDLAKKNFHRTYRMGTVYISLLKYVGFALLITILIIVLLTVCLNLSISNFRKLESMNQRVIKTYDIYTKVNMVHPTCSYFAIFKNDTTIKLRNQDKYSQLQYYISHFKNANDLLLDAVQIDDEGINDPVVLDILQGSVCQYVIPLYTQNCLQITGGDSFGLLGLNSKLRQALDPQIMAFTPDLTYATALSAMSATGAMLGFTHLVAYSAYSYLAQYFVDVFNENVDKYISFTFNFFWANLVVVLVSMMLIRSIVLAKLKNLDITMRGIFKVTPWKLFEENKMITNYLLQDFREELDAIKTFE